MVQINIPQREVTLKLVYYGPALSGKTTNLQVIHKELTPESRGQLVTLDTRDDRTLFFDMLPVSFRTKAGFRVKIKIFTVPGQVIHNATRRLVLAGADAIAFIADSQLKMARDNTESYKNMEENLQENGLDPKTMPLVIQYNKRDLPEIREDWELDKISQRSPHPVFAAVAINNEGVMETLAKLAELAFDSFFRRYPAERLAPLGLTPVDVSSIIRDIFPENDRQSSVSPHTEAGADRSGNDRGERS